ncbi:MAG TPA: DegT/DnrJ/EryC1/StrS aminotransferase family protein [Candidatus Woesearchaeota archaeon]|nr:DegT/DnrJ/EryC1/StrS aminotransferase family protein [Candidatus Woesearchaeota archaeon]
MDNIPIAKPDIEKQDIDAVVTCLKSGNISAGLKSEEFESRFAQELGVGLCRSVNSGTTALRIAIRALGIEKGSEVIVPDMSFAATAHAVVLEGLVPVFCDVGLDGLIDEELIKDKISSKTRAVLVVHLHGICAKIDRIKSLCEKKRIFLIEDCAQAFGSSFKGKPVGSFGITSAFSLYATKNITTGEGGMVCFNDSKLAERVSLWIDNGRFRGEEIKAEGDNLRMSDINAALGISQLGKYKRMQEKRKVIAKAYNSKLAGIRSIILPTEPGEYDNVYHHYNIVFKNGIVYSEAKEFFRSKGISIKRYYPCALSECPPFSLKPQKNSSFLAKNSFCIPIYSAMPKTHIKRVAEAAKQYVRRLG